MYYAYIYLKENVLYLNVIGTTIGSTEPTLVASNIVPIDVGNADL